MRSLHFSYFSPSSLAYKPVRSLGFISPSSSRPLPAVPNVTIAGPPPALLPFVFPSAFFSCFPSYDDRCHHINICLFPHCFFFLFNTRRAAELAVADGLTLSNMNSVMRVFTSIPKSTTKPYCAWSSCSYPEESIPHTNNGAHTERNTNSTNFSSWTEGSWCSESITT